MAGNFLILYILSSMLVSCQGQIKSPTNGTTLTFLPGTNGTIDWSLTVSASQAQVRTWLFKSRDGSRTGQLTRIIDNMDRGQKNLSLIPRFEIEKPATLILMNVDETYNGMYTLTLFTKDSSIDQSEVIVYIAEKPNVTVCSSNIITVNEGESLSCSCSSKGGNPPANVTWRKYGKEEISKTKERNNTLFLKGVSKGDAGNYECTAESYPDYKYRDTKTINVSVNYKPEETSITFFPDRAVLGEQVVITCNADGQPKPRYVLFHNDTAITGVRYEKKFTISPLMWNHTGTYNCTAINSLGRNSTSRFLNVISEGIVPSPTPASSTTILATSSTTGHNETVDSKSEKSALSPGIIAVIVIAVLLFLVVLVVLCYFKIKKGDGHKSHSNVNPGGSRNEENHYELEDNELAGQYDSVSATTSSKKKPESSSPAVYAAVNKENREGKPLYATLDTVAMENNGSKKKRDEDRPPPTEYASIDFARSDQPSKADLV